VLLTLTSGLLLLSLQATAGQWSIPDELRAQASVLNSRQLEFLTSGAVFKFIPERQLEHELANRDASSLRGLLEDLMALAEEMRYDPQRDMGAIPLNTASKRFNRGTLPTPAPLRDLERDPGPFSVHRYLFPKSGVPTFGGSRVAPHPMSLGMLSTMLG
jgi:agmatinase